MHPRTATMTGTGGRLLLALLAAGTLASACARLPHAPDVGSDARTALPAGAADYVSADAGRVVARLVGGTSPEQFAASYGTTLVGSIPEIDLQLLAVPTGETGSGFIRRLESDPRVVFVEPDLPAVSAESRQATIAFSEGWRTWEEVVDQTALARIGALQAHAVARGSGQLVAVLDTGVDLDHPALTGRLDLPGIEHGVPHAPADDRPQGLDTNEDGLIDGALGHGSHVAGLVLAAAPAARVLPVRVLDSDGVGWSFAIARGLVAAVQRGAQVANLSLGMPRSSHGLMAAIEFAAAAGVVVVAPSGNDGAAVVEFPASFPPVVAVAGTDAHDRKAAFSNYGAAVDLAAPAVALVSTYWDGGYATWSGTSMAAPLVAGVAALAYERAGARSAVAAAAIAEALRLGAASLAASEPTFVSGLGAGLVSAHGSLLALAGESDLVLLEPSLREGR